MDRKCFVSGDVQPIFGNDIFDVFQSIVECMYCGIIIAKKDAEFVIWNDQARKILGMSEANIPPEAWATHYGIYDSDLAIEKTKQGDLPLVKAIGGQDVVDQKLFVRNESQSGTWINCRAKPLKSSSGEIIGGVVVFEDITNNKTLEKEKLALLDVVNKLKNSKLDILEKLESCVNGHACG